MSDYQDAIVSFIDVLGFRNLVNSKEPEQIIEILDAMKKINTTVDVPEDEKPLSYAFTMSDAVVRIRPLDSEYRYGSLFNELNDLQLAQMELINKGIFIRGGLTIGKIHIGDNGEGPIFGPAFNRAYELETHAAIYPRIVLDHNVFSRFLSDQRLQSENNSLNFDKQYLNGCISQFSGNSRFVDYLGLDIGSYDAGYAGYLVSMKNHFTYIQKNLAEILCEKVRKKYIWLARYHNHEISKYTEKKWSKKEKADFNKEYEIFPDEFFASIKFDETFF